MISTAMFILPYIKQPSVNVLLKVFLNKGGRMKCSLMKKGDYNNAINISLTYCLSFQIYLEKKAGVCLQGEVCITLNA